MHTLQTSTGTKGRCNLLQKGTGTHKTNKAEDYQLFQGEIPTLRPFICDVSLFTNSALCVSTHQASKRDSRGAILLLKAASSPFFAEKNCSLSVFRHASLPNPQIFALRSWVLSSCTLFFILSCMLDHHSSPVDWLSAWHSTTQSSSIKGGSHFEEFGVNEEFLCSSFGQAVDLHRKLFPVNRFVANFSTKIEWRSLSDRGRKSEFHFFGSQ